MAFAEQLPRLDAEAYRQLAGLLARQAAEDPAAQRQNAQGERQPAEALREPAAQTRAEQIRAARAAGEFLEAVNANVQQTLGAAVGHKVEELMPDAPEGAQQKIAGEIFRELDLALRADPELQEQVRDAVRGAVQSGANVPQGHGAWREQRLPSPGSPEVSGVPGTQQRESVARLIARRAKAALPSVAKRVVADWTETVLRSSQARRARQSEAARRTEVGRGGAPAPVPAVPRRVDYSRMSDEKILNME
jgi:hypothetical protein